MLKNRLSLALIAIFTAVSPITVLAQENAVDWKSQEANWLVDPVQLTFADRFVKAGEGYFSPDGSKIIFQAVEQPEEGALADEFYAMFVANTIRDESGRTSGITNQISSSRW